jgi:hypothetical protein
MIESIDDLIVFLKHFHRHLLEDPSLPPEQIPDDLPDGLAKIYRELGGLIDLIDEYLAPFATQDVLMPVNRLNRIDGTIEFSHENQSNWAVRCPVDRKDPLVYSNAADAVESERRGFVVVCESLNHFLITLCLQEAVMSSHNLATVKTDNILEKTIAGENLEPLWLDGCYVFGEPSHNFYISKSRDIMVMEYGDIWVGSSQLLKDVIRKDICFESIEGC